MCKGVFGQERKFKTVINFIIILSAKMGSRYHEIMKTKPYLPFRMGYITEDMIEKARKELGETEEVKRNALIEMRKLIQVESNFVCRTDDAYLLQYLRARKFNVKKAFTLLQNTFLTKQDYPEIYDDFDITIVRKIFQTLGITCFPYRDEQGCSVMLVRWGKWDPEEFTIQQVFTGLTVAILFCIDDPATQICGVHIILDVQGSKVKHLRCLTPRYLHLFSRALRNCLPVRFKGIHIYNESIIFQYGWSMVKLFLSEKIRNRIHLHGDSLKSMHKFLPKAILPSEYGGNYDNFSTDFFFSNEIESYYEQFTELLKAGYQK